MFKGLKDNRVIAVTIFVSLLTHAFQGNMLKHITCIIEDLNHNSNYRFLWVECNVDGSNMRKNIYAKITTSPCIKYSSKSLAAKVMFVEHLIMQ